MKRLTVHQLIVISLLASPLTACMNPGRGVVPKGGEMTMPTIYVKETNGAGALAARPTQYQRNAGHGRNITSSIGAQDGNPMHGEDLTLWSRQPVSSFRVLVNPVIPLYIFPHFVYQAGEAYPKPGLTSAFFLYRSNHFAISSEMTSRSQAIGHEGVS